jgi:hypothetical protein
MTATRPENISQEWWDALTEREQEFVAEHERIHAEFWAELKEQDQ